MDTTMRFGVILGTRRAEVHERSIPSLTDDELLIKIEACNICTTDYELWTGARAGVQPLPMAGGHENSGVIVEKGSKVGDHFQMGDRVGIMLTQSCGVCEDCREGNHFLCKYKGETFPAYDDGYYGFFGFSTYKTALARCCFKFNSNIAADEAGFIEPLSTAIRSIKRVRVRPLENVLVIGAGTMGLLNAQVARAYGARVIISEPIEKKVAIARELGFKEFVNPLEKDFAGQVARTVGSGRLNVIIVCVGNTLANSQALEVAEKDTRIGYFAAGYPAPEIHIDSNMLHYKRFELIGIIGSDESDFEEAAHMLDNRAVNVEKLIEKRFPLDQIQEAYELASTPGSFRVSIHTWE